jgi:hypothetical protein
MTPIRTDMGDDPASYQTAMCLTPGKTPYMILDRKDNGATFRNSDRAGRRLAVKNGLMPKAIFDRGRELA